MLNISEAMQACKQHNYNFNNNNNKNNNHSNVKLYTLKMLGCFNPTLGQIWTNPNIGFKNVIKKM